jgi:hypothetical protein
MIVHCLSCGALLFREHRGRPRRYCSDACRRAADAARKATRAPVKPDTCTCCGTPITQNHTGRPRQYCLPCAAALAPQKTAQKSTATL